MSLRAEVKRLARERILVPYGIARIRKHGFWFVDVPRTSSTSLRVELASAFGIAYSKSNPLRKGSRSHWKPSIFPDHTTATQMRDILGPDVWKRIFKFTLVRNPWDRLVSLYRYRKEQAGTVPSDVCFRDYVVALDRHVTEGVESPLFGYHGHYLGASDFVVDENGEVIVDFVGKYETRDRAIREIGSRIGHPTLGSLHLLKTTRTGRHYSKYYDARTRDIVGRIFRRDVELFDYHFEEQG